MTNEILQVLLWNLEEVRSFSPEAFRNPVYDYGNK
jgi:hypothetical protein